VPDDDLDAYLDEVILGERPRAPVTVEVVPYDPAWPMLYEQHRLRVAAALGGAASRIEHIGSTAVPGLIAKPIIDVLVSVADPEDEDAFLPALARAGYDLRVREPGHRMFRPIAADANIHVWRAGDEEERRYLLLRDHLRTCAEDRTLYADAKRELAARTWRSVDHYAVAKTQVIEHILARARATAG
jgi:GrpB-like predicted nucleotidyltransferase (UPF0157 family)